MFTLQKHACKQDEMAGAGKTFVFLCFEFYLTQKAGELPDVFFCGDILVSFGSEVCVNSTQVEYHHGQFHFQPCLVSPSVVPGLHHGQVHSQQCRDATSVGSGFHHGLHLHFLQAEEVHATNSYGY